MRDISRLVEGDEAVYRDYLSWPARLYNYWVIEAAGAPAEESVSHCCSQLICDPISLLLQHRLYFVFVETLYMHRACPKTQVMTWVSRFHGSSWLLRLTHLFSKFHFHHRYTAISGKREAAKAWLPVVNYSDIRMCLTHTEYHCFKQQGTFWAGYFVISRQSFHPPWQPFWFIHHFIDTHNLQYPNQNVTFCGKAPPSGEVYPSTNRR
jgi:hypothetical protein